MADCVLACMVVVVVVDGRARSPLVANFVQCIQVEVDVDVMRIVGSSESLVGSSESLTSNILPFYYK